ncbi:MAG: BspA family leucine-rich repeat surface protein [Lachnospiraceae bacterium]|nr:BspA family leucine-rich repeat surface protein [Lachnospiraceae bacterium]
MKRQKLFKKRILAIILSATMIFAQADTYAVLAAEIENLGETVEYDESKSGLTEDLEVEESGTEETKSEETESESDSDEMEEKGLGEDGESGLTDESAPIEEPDSESTVESGTEDSDTVGDADREDGVAESSEEENETEETEETESLAEEPSEDESENNTAEVNENEASIVDSGNINDISWSIDANGLLIIEGTGDYVSSTSTFYNPPWAGRSDIKSAKVDVSGITSTYRMFYGCNILSNLDINGLDTSSVTNMESMFEKCSSLGSLDISGLDTSSVTDMERMFSGCSKLSSLDVSSFDTSKVRYMNSMFSDCSSLNSLDMSGFDTSIVYKMQYMFSGCSSLNSLDISGFNTSSVTDMSGMFSGCSSLSSLDISGLDTSIVNDMRLMFENCSSLNSLDISGLDTSRVTNMTRMFSGCSSLSSLDLSGFDTRRLTDMERMFFGCSSLNSLDLSGFDTKKVTYMRYIFSDCRSLSSLNVSGFDTSKVKSMICMFNNCSSLSSLDLSNFDMSKVQDAFIMIKNCKELSYICTPQNCKNNIELPISDSSDKWYDEVGDTYTEIPVADHSMVLYKNGYPGDGTSTMKKVVFISGINIEGKSYDKTPISYTGSPVVKDSFGNEITDVTLTCLYAGILTDGSGYEQTTQPPSQAGTYTLSVDDPESDSYIFSNSLYHFSIKPVVLTITAPSTSIPIGENVPELSTLTASVDGLIDGDELTSQPKLKYDADNIPTDVEGTYSIIPYDADAGNNYSINYVNGSLTISREILYQGISGALTWTIDYKGKLTIEGDGDYNASSGSPYGEGIRVPPWCEYSYSELIKSAEINVTGITTTKYMFCGCRWLQRIDMTNFDTSSVTDMSHMFSVSGVTSLDLNGLDTGKVTDMSYMFYGCDVTSLDLSGLDTSSVKDMSNMFEYCRALISLDLSGLDTSNVQSMRRMFNGCSSLKNLKLSGLRMDSVSNVKYMFKGCDSLVDLDLSGLDTSCVKSMSYMFAGFSAPSLDVSGLDISSVKDMSYMFTDCSNLTSLDVSGFDTSNVGGMSGMFSGCSSLTSLDISDFDTSSVKSLWGMFTDCSSLTSLDVSGFDTSKVEYMYEMFNGCSSLASLDVSGFDTSSVTLMTRMFFGCSGLSSLDVSGFNTSNVESMNEMFFGCSSLVSLDVSGFDTSKVVYMGDMFYGCSNLTSLNLGSFDMSSVKEVDEDDVPIAYYYSTFYGCNNLSYIRTPMNCPIEIEIQLPTGATGTDTWYSALNTPCTVLPTGLSKSIDLYKNGYPGDGVTKKAAFISGISINSMVYNGQSVRYFGNAVLVDSDKNKIADAILSSSYTYTGTLADGRVYEETTQAPYEAGNYKLLVKVESKDYSIQASYAFQIKPKTVEISAESVSVEIGETLPALTELSYTVSGLIGNDKLTTEPTLKYSESNISNTYVGCYDIIPYGALAGNNYRIQYVIGTLTVGDPDDDSSFELDERNGLDLSSLSCTIAPIKARSYNGAAYEPKVKVTVIENGRKKTLAEGTDYRVLYKNNVDAGTGKVIVRGSGIYKGYKEAPVKITPKAVKKLKIVTGGISTAGGSNGNISADAVNNGNISLPVYVYDAGKLLTKGEDYNLTYDSVKKGTLIVKVTGKDGSNYTGETKAKIAVYENASPDKIINPGDVNLQSYNEKYTGKAIKPAVEVRINGEVITSKNYKVQYQNNKNAGTAYVIVTGKGAYKGKVVTAFEITVDTQKLLITNTIKTQTYKGKYIKPSVTVKAGKKKLKKNTDYTVTYKNNLHAGTATVTVTGKGNYTGTATTNFTINPQKASKISIKGKWKDSDQDGSVDKGALTVTYGKRLLKNGVDYTLEAGEIKKNKIKVTLKGAEGSDFTGSVVKTLKIG